jgi:hypothetical protein
MNFNAGFEPDIHEGLAAALDLAARTDAKPRPLAGNITISRNRTSQAQRRDLTFAPTAGELASLLAGEHLAHDLLRTGMPDTLAAQADAIARRRLVEYTDHPDTTVADRWALGAAGRDLLTPGADALRLTHPDAQRAKLHDVTADGGALHVAGETVTVAPEMRDAVARLCTSRRLAGCLDHEPMYGLFDSTPGTRHLG